MIIAAYAGTGKSTFAAQTPGVIDLPSMPFARILPPPQGDARTLEGEKAAIYHLSDPRFPDNYLVEILKAERDYDFVLIPTSIPTVQCLEEFGRKMLLCYPDDSCREEYRARFIGRGNSEDFLSLFVDEWETFIGPLREDTRATHIVLGPREYLTDYRARFEEELRTDTTPPVLEETIHALEEKLAAAQREGWTLSVSCDGNRLCYPITNLDNLEEREFLYRVGKLAEEAYATVNIMPRNLRLEKMCRLTADRQTILEVLEKGRL